MQKADFLEILTIKSGSRRAEKNRKVLMMMMMMKAAISLKFDASKQLESVAKIRNLQCIDMLQYIKDSIY